MSQRHVEDSVSRWERGAEVGCSQRTIGTCFYATETLAGTVFTPLSVKTPQFWALIGPLFSHQDTPQAEGLGEMSDTKSDEIKRGIFNEG